MSESIELEYQQLVEGYAKKLPDKINEINSTFQALLSEWSGEKYHELIFKVHQLTGSAGIYGYDKISEYSLEIENILAKFDYDQKCEQSDFNEIIQLIRNIEDEVSQTEPKNNILERKCVETDLVYMLCPQTDNIHDSEWVKNLNDVLSLHKYRLKLFHSIDEMVVAFENNLPLSVLANYDFLSYEISYNLNNKDIKSILICLFHSTHSVFYSRSGEFSKRLEAVNMGCDQYFISPFKNELVQELDLVKYMWEESIKAIIIDDDKSVLAFYSKLFTESGIDVHTFSDISNIENELRDFKPDIILMDLNMPGYSGAEVVSVIRQQKIYEHIPIVFLSSERNTDKQLDAVSKGAEDFVAKDTDAQSVLHLVRYKAAHFKKMQSNVMINNLTGGFTYNYMCKEMAKYIDGYHHSQQGFVVSLLKIRNLDLLVSQYGYSACDQMVCRLYLLLEEELGQQCVIGHYDDTSLLVIHPESNEEVVRETLTKVCPKFKNILHYSDGMAFASEVMFGISPYQEGYRIATLMQVILNDLK